MLSLITCSFYLVISLIGFQAVPPKSNSLQAVASSQLNYEQAALDYFWKTVFAAEYPNTKVVEFTGETSYADHHYGAIMNCFSLPDSTKLKFLNFPRNQNIVLLNSQKAPCRVRSVKKKSRRLKLSVSPAVNINNKWIVLISVYKAKHFVEQYFLIMDNQGQIVDTCSTAEII